MDTQVDVDVYGDPDPYPTLSWIRAQEGVCPMAHGGAETTTWLVTRYDDARAALRDPRLRLDSRYCGTAPAPPNYPARRIGRSLLSIDPPDHTRLRRVVADSFSPRAVEGFRPRLVAICHAAVDAFCARGSADLVRDYALVVPVAVVHELLGVPDVERKDPIECFGHFRRAAFGTLDEASISEAEEHLGRIVDFRRRHRGRDLTSVLLGGLERGDVHNLTELYSVLFGLYGAGHITTIPFLGAAILRLLRDPDLRCAFLTEERVRADTVQEILRHDSAIQVSVNRYAVEDLDIAGTHVIKGDTVLVSIAAANRDGAQFEEADEFRVDRPELGTHLTFGHGAHYCLGAHLVRAEVEIALKTLFTRLPTVALTLAPDEVPWTGAPWLRGPGALPVAFDAVAPCAA